MWNKVRNNEARTDFFIRLDYIKNDLYNVTVTDLVKCWNLDLPTTHIVVVCKELNPLIEAEDSTLVSECIRLMSDHQRKDVQWTFLESSSSILSINLKSTFPRFLIPFKFDLSLKEVTTKEFFQNIFLPLLLSATEIKHQRDSLADLLKKKDAEITEYKLEGAVLCRKHIQTEKFDDTYLERPDFSGMFSKNSTLDVFEMFSSISAFHNLAYTRIKKVGNQGAFEESQEYDLCNSNSVGHCDNEIVEVNIEKQPAKKTIKRLIIKKKSRSGTKML